MAGMQQFGLAAQYVPVESIKDVFGEVERGRVDYGVVPVENSTEGVVNYTLDMFIDSDLKITAEIMLEVSQNLMNRSGNLEDIRKIFTHPQVPGQCRQWLEKNVAGIQILDAPSTARAAEMAKDDPEVGALHSMLTPFAEAGINLNRLDARPSGRQVWDYVFFLDMEGHIEEPKVAQAIEQLRKDCMFLKVLGSYPKSQ